MAESTTVEIEGRMVDVPTPPQLRKQRLVAEKALLDTDLRALVAFFDTPVYAALPTEDRLLLIAQHTHMRAYSDTLGTRIARLQGKHIAAAAAY